MKIGRNELRLDKRATLSGWEAAFISFLAIIFALLLFSLLFILAGINPISAYKEIFSYAFFNPFGLPLSINRSIFLLFSTFAFIIPYRAGLWNIGMTGQLYTVAPREKSPLHTHLRMELEEEDLILVDPRTFGRVLFIPEGGLDSHPALSRLGPEPLDHAFTVKHIKNFLGRHKTSLKAALLGQELAAGIGNIYADESCFRAGISPLRRADSLSEAEIRALRTAIRAVLRESIARKGTTIRDYQWDRGQSGGFSARLRVYGKEGEPCPKCRSLLRREIAAGRSTFFCGKCQK